jgi:hypothetical protein
MYNSRSCPDIGLESRQVEQARCLRAPTFPRYLTTTRGCICEQPGPALRPSPSTLRQARLGLRGRLGPVIRLISSNRRPRRPGLLGRWGRLGRRAGPVNPNRPRWRADHLPPRRPSVVDQRVVVVYRPRPCDQQAAAANGSRSWFSPRPTVHDQEKSLLYMAILLTSLSRRQ